MQNATIFSLIRTTTESSGGVRNAAPEGNGKGNGFAEMMLEAADSTDTTLLGSKLNMAKESVDAEQVQGRLSPDMTPQGWIATSIAANPADSPKSVSDSVKGIVQLSVEGTVRPFPEMSEGGAELTWPSVSKRMEGWGEAPSLFLPNNTEGMVGRTGGAPQSPAEGAVGNPLSTLNDGATVQLGDFGVQTLVGEKGNTVTAGIAVERSVSNAGAIAVAPVPEGLPKPTPFAQAEGSQTGESRAGLGEEPFAVAGKPGNLAANASSAQEGAAPRQFTQQMSRVGDLPEQIVRPGELSPKNKGQPQPDRGFETGIRPMPVFGTQRETVAVPPQNSQHPKSERAVLVPLGGMVEKNPIRSAFGERKPADKSVAPPPATGPTPPQQQAAQSGLPTLPPPPSSRPLEGSRVRLAQPKDGAEPQTKPLEIPVSIAPTNTTALPKTSRIGPVEIVASPNPPSVDAAKQDVALQPFMQTGELQLSSTNASLPAPGGSGAPDQPLARHVAQQLANIAQNTPNGAVGLTLSPEELGRVHLTFKNENGNLTISLTTERPETLDLMRRHIETLTQELRNIGYREVNIGFGQERAGQGGFQSGTGQQAGNHLPPDTPEQGPQEVEIQPATALAAESGTGIDIRL